MNDSLVNIQKQYQSALTDYLQSPDSLRADIIKMLCHQARRAQFRATDWLKLHERAVAELVTVFPATTTSTAQQAHCFLTICVNQWETIEPSSQDLNQFFPAPVQSFVLNQVQSAVIVTDLMGDITYWNAFAETLYQLTPEHQGRPFFSAITNFDGDDWSTLTKKLNQGAPWEGALTIQRHDGFTFRAHIIATLMKDVDQKPYGIISISRNLNGHHQIQHQLQQLNAELDHSLQQQAQALTQANEQLRNEIRKREYIEEIFRQNEERFYKLSANIPGMLFQWVRQPDGQDLLPYVSTRCCDILELEPGELYHLAPVLNHIPMEDLKRLQQEMNHSATNLSPVAWEGTFVTRSGLQKWLRMTAQPSLDSDGEIIWDGVLVDITARQQAALERERHNQQYENLVANVPGVIYRYTVSADWPTNFISDAIEPLTGYPVKHFLTNGMRYLDNITHPDDQLMLQIAIQETLKTHKPFQVEYRITTANGDIRWLLERGQIAQEAETGHQYLDGVMIDITSLKIAEKKIQASLEEKEVLLREIHHRVKNNLNVVHSMLAMQARQANMDKCKGALSDSQQRLQVMALIHEQLYRSEELSYINCADYVKALINNFVSMAYLNTARIPLKLDIERIKVSLETAIPIGLIINELLTNALKHAFPDNQAGLVQVILKRQIGGQLCLMIEDDGVGFPEDFDVLSHKSLGLRLVHILADQLDAELKIRSQAGTQFCLTFASRDPDEPEPYQLTQTDAIERLSSLHVPLKSEVIC